MISTDVNEIKQRIRYWERQDYVVYSLVNLDNGKRYIGRSRNPRERIRNHLTSIKRKKHKNPYIDKDSNCKFGYEILEEGISFDDRTDKERQYMIWYQTYDERYGYNVNDPCLKNFLSMK